MPSLEPRGAILDPEAAARAFTITRHRPGPALAPFVRHYWFVSWDLEEPHVQRILALPAVNVVIGPETSGIWGPSTACGERRLEGKGHVYGINFRPGGFQPLFGRSMHTLTDQVLPTGAVFSGDPPREPTVAALEVWMIPDLPPVDPAIAVVDRIVDTARTQRTMTRVEELAEAAALNVRTLQRLLRFQVGVGPKWLLRLFRLQDAAARLNRGDTLDQATLARSLGYYDQAHFIRDFTGAVGCSPARYARIQPTASSAR